MLHDVHENSLPHMPPLAIRELAQNAPTFTTTPPNKKTEPELQRLPILPTHVYTYISVYTYVYLGLVISAYMYTHVCYACVYDISQHMNISKSMIMYLIRHRLYVFMHIYIYVYICVYSPHINIYRCTSINMFICVYIYTDIHTRQDMHACPEANGHPLGKGQLDGNVLEGRHRTGHCLCFQASDSLDPDAHFV